MTPSLSLGRATRTSIIAAVALAAGAAAALAHGGIGGAQVVRESAPRLSISPVGHIFAGHFPGAPWLTAALFIFFRVLSSSGLAGRLQNAVWPLIVPGAAQIIAPGILESRSLTWPRRQERVKRRWGACYQGGSR